MKNTFLLWALLTALTAGNVAAQAPSSHFKAAETLLLTMGSPKAIDDNLQQMLTMQMEQIPAMKLAELEVRSFFAKYMNWEAIKSDLISLYMSEFTENELKDMTAFYGTPTGKKLAAKQSLITIRSAKIGQKKIEPHMVELQQILQKKMQLDN